MVEMFTLLFAEFAKGANSIIKTPEQASAFAHDYLKKQNTRKLKIEAKLSPPEREDVEDLKQWLAGR